MRPRTELAIGIGLLTVVGLIVAALGRREQRGVRDDDARRSTLLSGPRGARGYADVLERLGVAVERFRQRPAALAAHELKGARPVLAVLDPSEPLDGDEARLLAAFGSEPGGDLLVAGAGAEPLMRCFGYAVEQRRDSTRALPPAAAGREGDTRAPYVDAVLASLTEEVAIDSSRLEDATVTSCTVPPIAVAETLLVTGGGRVVALRLHRADVPRTVTLVADGLLFSNRRLRDTDAGPFALGLVLGRYDRMLVDEYHHGFGASGSLTGAVLAWSGHSPWGWAAWQLAVVGLLVLLFGAVRFGPPHGVIPRRRRSPLEHVRALATALAAARGHDVAVAALVRGLRRRVGHPGGGAVGEWLRSLGENVRSTRARAAVQTLKEVTRPGQPALGVLRAANAVEDVWEELRP